MAGMNKNIDGIRNMMKGLKADKYAIVNPDLVQLDEFVKELYLQMLCTTVQYENDPTDMQILYLQRIVRGAGVEYTVEDYMRKALEISNDDVKEFLSLLGKNRAKYYFTADGMILTALGEGNADNYEYLAELIELLGVNKKDLEYVSAVIRSILQQQASLFDAAKELVNERVKDLDFTPYIQNYYAGAVVDTEKVKHYYAPDKELSKDITYKESYEEQKVIFENLVISIDQNWTFTGCEKVVFKNCLLLGSENVLLFHSVGTVIFDSCKVKDFSNNVACFFSVNQIIIQQSEFINCGKMVDGDFCGGVFLTQGEKVDEIVIQGNIVLNCYIGANRYRSNYGVSGVLVGSGSVYHLTVIDNDFIGCRCINNGNYTAALIAGYFDEVTEENNRFSGELRRTFWRR